VVVPAYVQPAVGVSGVLDDDTGPSLEGLLRPEGYWSGVDPDGSIPSSTDVPGQSSDALFEHLIREPQQSPHATAVYKRVSLPYEPIPVKWWIPVDPLLA
jgi:hypothetical protein